ncbi:hypothetical protein J7F01_08805 [Streptomyces sp. ISL-22]|uniref:hypothetical protein n=1 Tax=unclassified Streptomyces TaxID=2593676 RepID=UPI001BE7CDF8|nr:MULTISPECIES: hypothetical protein [unclassified Streptomyces]MBT2418024.1 hypothetical protein [Streptomyces sp. ISL-24]MBT2432301.1 hypothetical protein [Streptomyces sp. ISL-22]
MAASGDQQIPGWPLLTIRLTPDGGASVDDVALAVPPGSEPRAAALTRAAETAIRVGRPVRARLTEADGSEWLIAVHPDADSTVLQAPAAGGRKGRKVRTKTQARAAAAPQAPPRPAAVPLIPQQPAAQPPHWQQQFTPLQELLSADRSGSSVRERMTAAAERRDWAEALALCEQCLREAPDHEVDRLRTVQAGLTARSGDVETAYVLFRALAQERAERHGPDDPQAVAAADAAQEQWAALPAGDAADLLDLRTRVPGPGSEGLTRARKLVVRSRLR